MAEPSPFDRVEDLKVRALLHAADAAVGALGSVLAHYGDSMPGADRLSRNAVTDDLAGAIADLMREHDRGAAL